LKTIIQSFQSTAEGKGLPLGNLTSQLLVNIYMNLSATMKMFGTAMNSHFGEVEETGILVTIADIYETKKERHINTYKK
jgi:hypothetical protein